MLSKIEKFFNLKENDTNFKTEFVAGLVTFFSMSYIIVVNPATLTGFGEPGAMFIATIFFAVVFVLSILGLLLIPE